MWHRDSSKNSFKSIQKDTLNIHEGDHQEISSQIQDNPFRFQAPLCDKKEPIIYHKDRNKDNELTFNTTVCLVHFFFSSSN